MNPFEAIAHKYDLFNRAESDGYVRLIATSFGRADIEVREVLDVGCGTGVITLALAALGYDMVGVDVSEDMLGTLKSKPGSEGVLALCQDMRELDLYGTVQGAVCTYDCFNYLESVADLRAALSSVALFTEPGGIFVFDINTRYTYETLYGNSCYVFEEDGDMLVWQNFYTPSSRSCRFDLTLFERGPDGSYRRSDECQRQHFFSPRTVGRLLDECGFEILDIYGSADCAALDAASPKAYYICKRTNKKGNKVCHTL